MNKISIDFPIGCTPTAIPVELELASARYDEISIFSSNTFDLTEIIPIYLEYKGKIIGISLLETISRNL
ncbi:hypothetical protein [Bacteroides ovatus]|uniref:hypothetical protein n=1 Tax=Bacteroides ovatus TaxID=28116 RepID=UPI0021658D24|nr:hypothetical protein [Bacteroides ovatus]MCS3036361.1 hypothetical protein [Bacteroides ovatus]